VTIDRDTGDDNEECCMLQLPWYVLAIGAALVWGLHYPLIDYALRRVSLFSVMLLTVLPILLVAPFFHRQLAIDLAAFRALDGDARFLVLLVAFTSFVGTLLLFLSIRSRNATLASLIEITYPVFVALFAWLLFREVQASSSTAVGALLVFAGVAIVILGNR
jgi:drug/metabolite transporter (DMT)-like permease